MEIECEICRNDLAVTLADGTPMCGKCQDSERDQFEGTAVSVVIIQTILHTVKIVTIW